VRLRLTAVTIVVLVVAAGACAIAAASANARKAGPPVIHEKFTVLPCSGKPGDRTTLQLEGCAEHDVLAGDDRIDRLAAQIYGKLNTSGRRAFVSASTDWLSYRNAYCSAEASPLSGGSELPLAYADCLATEDGLHLSDLRALLKAISAP